MPMTLPPPAAGTQLCPEHASELATVAVRAIADMTARAASSRTLHGRRLLDGEALDAIRAWAVAAGYPVSTKGSVASPIIAAYRDAAVIRDPEPEPRIEGDVPGGAFPVMAQPPGRITTGQQAPPTLQA